MEHGLYFLVIFFLLVTTIFSHKLDKNRIRAEVPSRGGTVISLHWSPFGKGWFGNDSDRVYRLKYLDSRGKEHKAFVKTSMFSGVYFHEDKTEEPPSRYIRVEDMPVTETKTDQLKQENERLKAELEKLKNNR